MERTSNYVVRELAKDSYSWRIDWFGATTYAERHRRSSQPLVEVQISRVPDDYAGFNDFFRGRKQQWPQIRRIRLPVGFLTMLRIGDIWRDGKLHETPDYEIANFANLEVEKGSSTLIKAGLPDEKTGQYYLPLAVHPYHMSFTQSYCVHVEHEGASIVIPCSELLRFYFGSSSTLMARLFDAPFNQELFWVGHKVIDINGLAKIQLASGISGRSATDVGRIAFSKDGRSAAELVGNSCIAATARGEVAYLKAAFPFTGTTQLSASGIWVPRDDNERGVFLVFRLRSCSHQFPFSRLQYTSEHAQPSPMMPSPTKVENAPITSTTFARRKQEAKILSDVEPDKAKRKKGLGIYFGDMQFPDLARKVVSRVNSEDTPTVHLFKQGLSIIDSFSVGEDGMVKSVQPIELSTVDVASLLNSVARTSAKPPPPHAILLLQVLQQMSQLPHVHSVDIIRLSERQRFDYLSTMPQIVDENGELASSCLVMVPIAGGSDKISTRNRQVSIGRALELYRTFYFLIPEPHDGGAVELNVILDTVRSIRTTADLLAAIGLHFGSPREEKITVQLNAGVVSKKFIVTEPIDSMTIGPLLQLFSEMEHFLNTAERNLHNSMEEPAIADIPEYLK